MPATHPPGRPSILLVILAALLLLTGLVELGGGLWLVGLGGSRYYAVAAVGWLVAGVAVWRVRGAVALAVYGVTYAFTWIWALREVGLQGWQLEPRLLLPTLFGLLLLTPPVTRRLQVSGRPGVRYVLLALGSAGVAAAAIAGLTGVGGTIVAASGSAAGSAPAAAASQAGDASQWRYYGGTARGERYSPAAQITPSNVVRLEPAWHLRTGDLPSPGENEHGYEFNDEATPIKVGDTLYLCTPHRRIFAIDAQTGAVRWKFDPRPDTANNAYLACRGVAYADVDALPATAPCRHRIISTTADARLMALDAASGAPCADFGDHGYVSLTAHLGRVPKGFHFITSQPLVARGKVILGGWIYDGQATGEPSGVVRAFDARSGELAWAWDLGRPDQAVEHPAADEVFTTGTPNAWGTYTADLDRGMVFLPLGNAVPDYYGSRRRPFDEAFSSSVVALDIDTGRPLWHFQTMHHDLWDMDVPIGPTLVDLPGPDGATIPALLQTTKRGELFLLDRRDGHPISAIAERPAPTDALPEERAAMSRTQPYSVGMPSFAPPPIRESDAWGATPLDQLLCRIEFRRLHYEGAYTPITEQKTLVYPSFDGIVDWQGASVDPRSNLMVANLSYIPFTGIAIPRAKAEADGLVKPWNGQGQPPRPKDFSINPQYGTPYVTVVKPWLNFLGVPCKAPPWGQLAEVDLDARRLRWLRDIGTTRDTGPFRTHFNLPFTTGVFNIAGSVVTAGGLVFLGATADDYLRAIDESTGRELWKARLPAGGQATPMTYVGSDGRQYVVISAGGHGGLGTRAGDDVLAYALPRASAAQH